MINIIDRKFFTDYFNGPLFADNPSDFKFHLYGSVMNMTKALYTVNVAWNSASTISSQFTLTTGSDIITRSSGSFILDGMSAGDVVDVFAYNHITGVPVATTFLNATVTIADKDIMIITGLGASGISAGVYGSATDSDLTMVIRAKSDTTGFFMNFGLIANNDPINFNSQLDDSEQGYYVVGVGTGGPRSTAFVDGNFLGQYRGSQTGALRARYVQNVDVYTQQFEIEHIFRIIPYYLEGEKTNLQSLITPDRLSNGVSLKYVVEYQFRNVISDPNTAKIIQDETQLGSVGWFNQNYNNLNNVFSISNLTYEDVATNPATSLIVSELTTVKFRVTSTEASFVDSSSIIQIFASFLPEQDDYQLEEETFNEIWEVEEYRDVLGNTTATGQTIIQDVKSTFVDANNIDVEVKILYVSKSADDNYLIAIEVANDGIVSDDSNKVNLLIDCNNFQKSACIENLLILNEMKIVDVEGNEINKFGGYIEEGIKLVYDFSIDHDLEAVINSMTVQVVAFNPTKSEFFAILDENVPFETEAAKNDGTYDYQDITTDVSINYQLEDADTFGRRTIVTGALTANLRKYTGELGIKIPWQAWAELPAADEQFTDATEENNGLNKDSSNYNLLEGYEIRAFIKVAMTGLNDLGVTGSTDYFLSKEEMNIGGYDDNPNITKALVLTDITGLIPVTGGLLTNGNTKGKYTITPTVGSFTTAHYGVVRLEAYKRFSDRLIFENNEASIKGNYSDNAFVGPLVKNTAGSGLEFLFEIKEDFIEENTTYKLSIMVRCPISLCLVFTTNVDPGIDGNFTISMVGTSFTPLWTFEDLSTVATQDIDTAGNGLNGTQQIVQFCDDPLSGITDIDFKDNKIVGTVNLSLLSGFTGSLTGHTNPELTEVVYPLGGVVDNLQVQNCDITGTMDMTPLSNSTNAFTASNNSNLLVILFDAGVATFTTFNLQSCGLTGPLDMENKTFSNNIFLNLNSNLTAILNFKSSGSITQFRFESNDLTGIQDFSNGDNIGVFTYINTNPNLTGLLFPTTNATVTTSQFRVNDNNLTGPLDISFQHFGGAHMHLQNNTLLTDVLLSATLNNTAITQFYLYNCDIGTVTDLDNWANMTSVNNSLYRFDDNNMTTAEVNKILVDLDTISVGVFTGRGIQIHGTNAAPDGSAGGNDGDAAVTSLTIKGFTVTTN